MNIACALRWGVSLVGGILYWVWLTLYETKFQVKGIHLWTVLSRGRDCEEGQHVALINHFVKCLHQSSSSMYLSKIIVIKIFWTIVNTVRYVIMVRES